MSKLGVALILIAGFAYFTKPTKEMFDTQIRDDIAHELQLKNKFSTHAEKKNVIRFKFKYMFQGFYCLKQLQLIIQTLQFWFLLNRNIIATFARSIYRALHDKWNLTTNQNIKLTYIGVFQLRKIYLKAILNVVRSIFIWLSAYQN